MEDTRVFVSGLPPTFTNEQLRTHFASHFQVTDSHVLPKRRIGFVGFKNASAAKRAIDYFNKTYIRMSKISVEVARPAHWENNANEHLTMRHSKQYILNDSVSNTLKRKRGADATRADPKLQEYFVAMQHPTKTKTWANDDGTVEPMRPLSLSESQEKTEMSSNGESWTRSKELRVDDGCSGPRKSCTPLHLPSSRGQTRERVLCALPDTVIEQQLAHEDAAVGDLSTMSHGQDGPKSDVDWLRSKTSRLLGLLDDEEQADRDGQSQHHIVANLVNDDDRAPDSGVLVASSRQKSSPEIEKSEGAINTDIELIRNSARLFVRNLPYGASESDLRPIFVSFGNIEEIHIAFDPRSTTSKGFAYVQYADPSSAVTAYEQLDGKHFQGRLLHILPASAKKTYKIDEHELSKLPLKKQKQIKRRAEASSSAFNWNSLYMNVDAVMSSVAEKLGVSKANLLDPTSSDAAVKQAHAETHIIQETKAYFSANGVNVESFKQQERGNTAILVKNFSFGIKLRDLRELFEQYGQITQLLMPPGGTIAIVEFARPDEAQKAFRGLAYRKLGGSVLFLERAPRDLFNTASVAPAARPPMPEKKTIFQRFSITDTFAAGDVEDHLTTSTLYVRNLNFSTTSKQLSEAFQPLDGFLSARVKTKSDPKRPGQTLSMGFGFVEFRTRIQAQAALAAMDGYNLGQHELIVKASYKGLDAAEERRLEDNAKKIMGRSTKIIIKNLPFQATQKDVRSLFGAYGQLRSVRVPKKFDRSTRGFAFADFVSAREAENAMDALKNTHLLGRKLVLEYASQEAVDPEEEIQRIERKVGQQVQRVKTQELTQTARKKFNVGAQEEEDY